MVAQNPLWYKNAVFYEVYFALFMIATPMGTATYLD